MLVLTCCRAQGNGTGAELPPSLLEAFREWLLQICPSLAPHKGCSSADVFSKYVPARVHTQNMSVCAFLCNSKSRDSSLQTSFRKERADQRRVTVVIISVHALLDDTHSPQQFQLGKGKCLNRTAWSSIGWVLGGSSPQREREHSPKLGMPWLHPGTHVWPSPPPA